MYLYTVTGAVGEEGYLDLAKSGDLTGKNVYVNMTNKCPCSCVFCLRRTKQQQEGNTLWLKEGEPSVETMLELFAQYDLNVINELVFCGFGVSLLSGILTLAVLSLPIIINTTETALKQIPQDWREASLALGATRFETIMKVILPNALPGILTGAILALARAAGETAAVMYTGTVFFTQKDGVSLFEPVMALPYHVYVMATSGTNIEGTRHLQYGTSLVLVALVFLMSLGAIILRERRRSR